MIGYPAVFEYDNGEKVYNVHFPDLPGCLTYGESIDEAKKLAREALTGFLQSIDARKMKIPNPSRLEGDNVYNIEPETPVAFAIWLRKRREAQGLSQSEVARKLGIKYQTYQRIESPSKTNPTLKTIVKLEQVFGNKIVQV